MGCFFDLRIDTWADALLALSVMQAAACDVRDRWQHGPRCGGCPFAPSLRQALTQATPSRVGPSGRGSATGGATNEEQDSSVAIDVAALKVSGSPGPPY